MREIFYNPIEGLFILNPSQTQAVSYDNIRDNIKWNADSQRKGKKYGFKNLTLALTTACNLKCKYCWQTHAEDRNSDMKKETIDYWLDFFLDTQVNAPGKVLYYGGEPTLRMDLIEYASEKIKRITEERNITGVEQHMFTNGMLLNEKNLDILEKAGVFIVLSLDGNPETTERTRGLSASVYEKTILNAVESLHRRGMKFGIVCTIDDIHFSPEKTAEYLVKTLRPSSIEFNLRHDKEMVDKFNKEADFSYDSFFKAWDIALDAGVRVVDLAKRIKAYAAHEPLINSSSGSKNKLSIMNNGNISTYNGAISFAEMQINPNSEDWIDKFRTNWQRNITTMYEKCKDCEAIYICGQGSAFSSYLQYGDINAIPAYHCYLRSAELEYIKRRLATCIDTEEKDYIISPKEMKEVFNIC